MGAVTCRGRVGAAVLFLMTGIFLSSFLPLATAQVPGDVILSLDVGGISPADPLVDPTRLTGPVQFSADVTLTKLPVGSAQVALTGSVDAGWSLDVEPSSYTVSGSSDTTRVTMNLSIPRDADADTAAKLQLDGVASFLGTSATDQSSTNISIVAVYCLNLTGRATGASRDSLRGYLVVGNCGNVQDTFDYYGMMPRCGTGRVEHNLTEDGIRIREPKGGFPSATLSRGEASNRSFELPIEADPEGGAVTIGFSFNSVGSDHFGVRRGDCAQISWKVPKESVAGSITRTIGFDLVGLLPMLAVLGAVVAGGVGFQRFRRRRGAARAPMPGTRIPPPVVSLPSPVPSLHQPPPNPPPLR